MNPFPVVRSLKSASVLPPLGVYGLAPTFLSSLALGVVGVRGVSKGCSLGRAKGVKREKLVL
jgi:hypothetical protein